MQHVTLLNQHQPPATSPLSLVTHSRWIGSGTVGREGHAPPLRLSPPFPLCGPAGGSPGARSGTVGRVRDPSITNPEYNLTPQVETYALP